MSAAASRSVMLLFVDILFLLNSCDSISSKLANLTFLSLNVSQNLSLSWPSIFFSSKVKHSILQVCLQNYLLPERETTARKQLFYFIFLFLFIYLRSKFTLIFETIVIIASFNDVFSLWQKSALWSVFHWLWNGFPYYMPQVELRRMVHKMVRLVFCNCCCSDVEKSCSSRRTWLSLFFRISKT